MIGEYLLKVMELIGTVAFAVSGSLVAIGHGLDLFGVIIVACTTAVGGGMTRDLLMGHTPPDVFYSHTTLLVALLTSLAVFVLAYVNIKRFKGLVDKIEHVNVVFDAIGLAAFSVAGVEIACNSGYDKEIMFSVTMGVITGVGGGVLRDVLVNEKPYVLTKHVYAVASIIGGGVYYALITCTDYLIAPTVASVIVTITIRLLAAKYRWKLPKIDLSGEVGERK